MLPKICALEISDKLVVAQSDLESARGIAQAIADIEKYFEEHPMPDKGKLEALKDNRRKAMQLQADRDAASMTLTVTPGEVLVRLSLLSTGQHSQY